MTAQGLVDAALRPALPLAVAYHLAADACTLSDSIECVAARFGGGSKLATWLSAPAIAALLNLEIQLRGEPSDLCAVYGHPPAWVWVRWPTSASTLTVVSRGRSIEVTRLMPEPRLAHLRGFLSHAEAAHIISLARTSLKPSRVVNHSLGGDRAVRSVARSSSSCKISASHDLVVRRAVQRAAYLTGLAPQHAEAVQVVHYLPGQEYRPHFDWFTPDDSRFEERTRTQGNRLVSVFVYLTHCQAGGATAFPMLGKSFAPEEGCALCWYNLKRSGEPDERTLHAGEPVERGEKWGMNIWLRQLARPPRARVHASLTCATGAWGNVTIATRLHVAVAAMLPAAVGRACCERCGDLQTPLGLCLCKGQYGQGQCDTKTRADTGELGELHPLLHVDRSGIYSKEKIFSRG